MTQLFTTLLLLSSLILTEAPKESFSRCKQRIRLVYTLFDF